MQVAIVLYNQFTLLDAIGPYQVLIGLPGAEVVFAAESTGRVITGGRGLQLHVDNTLADVPQPDVVVVPGGPGAEADQLADGPLHDWLRAVDQTSQWTTSVCTGSLILASAGLLAGRRATTYWMAMDELERLGAKPVTDRVVFDGKYMTAAGVSSGIDGALALAGRIAGDPVAQEIQLGIEYDPQPPYDAGSPAKAPNAVVESVRRRAAASS
jgi:putative intracellular protease/amidase